MALLLLFVAHTAMAENITEEKAKQIAATFFSSNQPQLPDKQLAKGKEPAVRLAHTSTGYYVFNRGTGDGYVIVASDDRAVDEVLGYADEGTFELATMPENMRWWLGEYDRQMATAKDMKTTQRLASMAYADIEPMIATKWSQSEPFNAMCPVLRGQRCLTGCVAVAMAQLMYYHKWPLVGTGSKSYGWGNGGRTLSADFSNSTYNWDSMTDTYNEQSTQQAKNAVARLMADAGIAAEVNYSLGGSAASDGQISKGMIDHFQYDKGMRNLQRNFYGLEEWTDLLYGELAAKRPVYYGGVEFASGGHAFIVDGYRSGYFHVNWGWGGMDDGYFKLTALDPNAQGIGNGSTGYNYDQLAVVGIQKAQEGSTYTNLLYCGDDFYVGKVTTNGQHGRISFNGMYLNAGHTELDVTLGLMVVGAKEDTTYVSSQTRVALPAGYYLSEMTVYTADLPMADGRYRIYPAYKVTGTDKWTEMRTPLTSSRRYVIAQTSGGNISFSSPERAFDLEVAEAELLTTAYKGCTFNVKTTLRNSGTEEYYNNVGFAIVNAGTLQAVCKVTKKLVDLPAGAESVEEIQLTAPNVAGEYELVICDNDNNVISREGLPFTVQDIPTGDVELRLAGPIEVMNADPSNLTGRITVECVSGFYHGPLYALIWKGDGHGWALQITSSSVIAQGEKTECTFTWDFSYAEEGLTYYLAAGYKPDGATQPKQIGESMPFTFTTANGISDIPSDEKPTAVFTLSGTKVKDLNSQPGGIYIVKTAKGVKRVLKK